MNHFSFERLFFYRDLPVAARHALHNESLKGLGYVRNVTFALGI